MEPIGRFCDSNLSLEVQQACVLESLSLGVWRLGQTGKLEASVGDTYRCTTRCKGMQRNLTDFLCNFSISFISIERYFFIFVELAGSPWHEVASHLCSGTMQGVSVTIRSRLRNLLCASFAAFEESLGISWGQGKGKIPKFEANLGGCFGCLGGGVQIKFQRFHFSDPS